MVKKIKLEEIKKIRELTGAGIADAKEALLGASSFDEALKILKSKGAKILEKKSERSASQGIVASYIHLQGKVGAMVELKSETDFVARSEPFQKLAYDLAVQVAGMDPLYLTAKDVPASKKKEIEDFETFCKEKCLLEQPLIKDPNKTVGELIQEVALQVQENIGVARFVRFAVGEKNND